VIAGTKRPSPEKYSDLRGFDCRESGWGLANGFSTIEAHTSTGPSSRPMR
jgi:hypothetical protein